MAPPSRPKVTAIRALRGDTAGRMHAQHQLSDVQYHAARGYQALVEQATGAAPRSVDLARPVMDCTPPRDPLPPRQIVATKRLRSVEATLKDRFGTVGLSLVRVVLADGTSVEAAARAFGAETEREARSVCWLFRRSLDTLARALGLASSTRRAPPLHVSDPELEPALDQARHAEPLELAVRNLRSARGRANGRG